MQPVAKETVSMGTEHRVDEASHEDGSDVESQISEVAESLLMDIAYNVAFSRAALCKQRQVCFTVLQSY